MHCTRRSGALIKLSCCSTIECFGTLDWSAPISQSSWRRARARYERRELRRVHVHRVQPQVRARRVEEALVVDNADAAGRAAAGDGALRLFWRCTRTRLQAQRTAIRRGIVRWRCGGGRGAVVLLSE